MSAHPEVAVVEVSVATDPATAFRIFTEETELWWRKGPQYRVSGRNPGTLAFEPGLGGRLFEQFDTNSGTKVVVTGKITVWEPGARLAFEWRGANFAAEEVTLVEVLFRASGSGTRVTVRHSGWASLRTDHPARHGLDTEGFLRMLGMWWGALLTSLREHAQDGA